MAVRIGKMKVRGKTIYKVVTPADFGSGVWKFHTKAEAMHFAKSYRTIEKNMKQPWARKR